MNCSPDEVLKIIKMSTNDFAIVLDNIPHRLNKSAAECITPVLTFVIISQIEFWQFSEKWKIASIESIAKGDDSGTCRSQANINSINIIKNLWDSYFITSIRIHLKEKNVSSVSIGWT